MVGSRLLPPPPVVHSFFCRLLLASCAIRRGKESNVRISEPRRGMMMQSIWILEGVECADCVPSKTSQLFSLSLLFSSISSSSSFPSLFFPTSTIVNAWHFENPNTLEYFSSSSSFSFLLPCSGSEAVVVVCHDGALGRDGALARSTWKGGDSLTHRQTCHAHRSRHPLERKRRRRK